jgi:hypothetical protein
MSSENRYINNLYRRIAMQVSTMTNFIHDDDLSLSITPSTKYFTLLFYLYLRAKIDFALIRIQNDIKNFKSKYMPTKYCHATISDF